MKELEGHYNFSTSGQITKEIDNKSPFNMWKIQFLF